MKAEIGTREERRALFRGMIKSLREERAILLKRVQSIEAELTEYGFGENQTASPKTIQKKIPGKLPREGSLKDFILKVIGTEPVKTAGLAGAVLDAGFQTSSKTHQQGVSIALAQLSKDGLIRKVKRGVWRAR